VGLAGAGRALDDDSVVQAQAFHHPGLFGVGGQREQRVGSEFHPARRPLGLQPGEPVGRVDRLDELREAQRRAGLRTQRIQHLLVVVEQRRPAPVPQDERGGELEPGARTGLGCRLPRGRVAVGRGVEREGEPVPQQPLVVAAQRDGVAGAQPFVQGVGAFRPEGGDPVEEHAVLESRRRVRRDPHPDRRTRLVDLDGETGRQQVAPHPPAVRPGRGGGPVAGPCVGAGPQAAADRPAAGSGPAVGRGCRRRCRRVAVRIRVVRAVRTGLPGQQPGRENQFQGVALLREALRDAVQDGVQGAPLGVGPSPCGPHLPGRQPGPIGIGQLVILDAAEVAAALGAAGVTRVAALAAAGGGCGEQRRLVGRRDARFG
jgi:hypothetical protein